MLPEDRLGEAKKQLRIVQQQKSLPKDTTKKVYETMRSVQELQDEIVSWREYVDDSEVVDND